MKSTSTLDVLDGAEAVVVHEEAPPFVSVMAVWYGGTTFRVFVPTGDVDRPLQETGTFSLSDENGEPVSQEEAEEHAREWLEQTIEEQRG